MYLRLTENKIVTVLIKKKISLKKRIQVDKFCTIPLRTAKERILDLCFVQINFFSD